MTETSLSSPHPQPLAMVLALALDILQTPKGALIQQAEDGGAYPQQVARDNAFT